MSLLGEFLIKMGALGIILAALWAITTPARASEAFPTDHSIYLAKGPDGVWLFCLDEYTDENGRVVLRRTWEDFGGTPYIVGEAARMSTEHGIAVHIYPALDTVCAGMLAGDAET